MHIKNGFEIKSYLSYLFIFHFFKDSCWTSYEFSGVEQHLVKCFTEKCSASKIWGLETWDILWFPSTAVFPRFPGWGFHWNNLRFMKCCFIYKWHVRCCFCLDYYYLLLLVLLLLYFFGRIPDVKLQHSYGGLSRNQWTRFQRKNLRIPEMLSSSGCHSTWLMELVWLMTSLIETSKKWWLLELKRLNTGVWS